MTAPRVLPFRPLRFQTDRLGDLGSVLAPPYDVITPELAATLRGKHTNNIVRLTNPEGGVPDRYAGAAETLKAWVSDGVLARESSPSVFVHRHSFRSAATDYTRTGVWALLELAPFAAGVVLPHERTMSGPKADRLALMRACRAQLSPVFFICSDRDGPISDFLSSQAKGRSTEQAEFPVGERHEIWRVSGAKDTGKLTELMQGRSLLIADGHHRYETALAYRDGLIAEGSSSSGTNAHEYILAYIVPENDPGLLLLPTHRVLEGGGLDWTGAVLKETQRFEVARLDDSQIESTARALVDEAGQPSFVLVAGDQAGGWFVRLRKPDPLSQISAVAFHEHFLMKGLGLSREEQVERVSYLRDAEEALNRVRSGEAQAAALLAAPTVAQVRDAAASGERTPPKTTYFWPKVPTGVAIHVADPREKVSV